MRHIDEISLMQFPIQLDCFEELQEWWYLPLGLDGYQIDVNISKHGIADYISATPVSNSDFESRYDAEFICSSRRLTAKESEYIRKLMKRGGLLATAC